VNKIKTLLIALTLLFISLGCDSIIKAVYHPKELPEPDPNIKEYILTITWNRPTKSLDDNCEYLEPVQDNWEIHYEIAIVLTNDPIDREYVSITLIDENKTEITLPEGVYDINLRASTPDETGTNLKWAECWDSKTIEIKGDMTSHFSNVPLDP